MLPSVNIERLVAEVPVARRNNNIGRLSRKAFVFATCVGSQFASATQTQIIFSDRAAASSPSRYTPESVIHDIDISDIATEPEYKILTRLEKIAMLEDGWDGYDSPAISKKAIAHSRQAIKLFHKDVFTGLTAWPNEYGGILLRYLKADKTVFACDLGDDCMFYYIALPGEKPRDFAFIEYTDRSMSELADLLAQLVKDLHDGHR